MNNRKMRRTYLTPFLIVLVTTAASGCATPALVKYAGKEEFREYRLTDADSAVINDEGTLLVCLQGWTVKTNPNRDPTSFHIRLPLSQSDYDSNRTPAFHLAAKQVGKRCPKPSSDSREIPVRHVDADYFVGIDDDPPTERIEVVYVVNSNTPRGAGLVYQHPVPIVGNSPYVWIYLPPGEAVKPSQAALIALPLAVVADVVLGVVFVVACIFAGGHCV